MAFDKERAQYNVLLRSLLNERSGWKVRPDWLDKFENVFVTAIGEADAGHPEILAMILRSEGFLGLLHSSLEEEAKHYLEWLARYVEGSFDRPPHRPPARFGTPVTRIADRARQIQQEKRCPRKAAITEAMEEAKAKGINLTFEQIQTELRRSKKQPKRKTAAKTR